MRIPVVSNIEELDSGPRKFLLFASFNVISWQCLVGSVLVLFAREIDMPPSLVGWLLSFMPLSTLAVLFTVPLVMQFGSKRVMMTAWLLRNCFAFTVFLMPLSMRYWGPQGAWSVLIICTLGFCLFRAVGAGGWLPWLHEMVPGRQRGYFFSAEQGIIQGVTVLIVFGQALALRGDPSVNRFLGIYAVGIAAGLLSLGLMARVPGGGGTGRRHGLAQSFQAYRAAWHDRRYVRFVLTATLCFSSIAWLGSAMIMFLRDGLGLPSRNIMMIMALASFGVLCTIQFWARFVEHSGSGLTMFKTLFTHSIGAAACVFVIPGAWWTLYALVPAIVLLAICAAAFFMAAHRALLNFVKSEGVVGYTSIWTAGTALAMGVTPILAGFVIDRFGMAGFRACFAISAVGGVFCALASVPVVGDGVPMEVRPAILLNPALPVRTIARVLWVTAGLHESSRPETPEAATGKE